MELTTDLDPQLAVDIELEASLAGLTYTWTQGPYTADYLGHLVVRVEPPLEAYLDTAAGDYLTPLRVRLTASRDGAVEIRLRAPPAYLAWPAGRDAPAVLWDKPTAASLAPNGIVSDVIRAQFQKAAVDH